MVLFHHSALPLGSEKPLPGLDKAFARAGLFVACLVRLISSQVGPALREQVMNRVSALHSHLGMRGTGQRNLGQLRGRCWNIFLKGPCG